MQLYTLKEHVVASIDQCALRKRPWVSRSKLRLHVWFEIIIYSQWIWIQIIKTGQMDLEIRTEHFQ